MRIRACIKVINRKYSDLRDNHETKCRCRSLLAYRIAGQCTSVEYNHANPVSKFDTDMYINRLIPGFTFFLMPGFAVELSIPGPSNISRSNRSAISSKIRLYAVQCGSTPVISPPVGAIALYGQPPLQYMICLHPLHSRSTNSLKRDKSFPGPEHARSSCEG